LCTSGYSSRCAPQGVDQAGIAQGVDQAGIAQGGDSSAQCVPQGGDSSAQFVPQSVDQAGIAQGGRREGTLLTRLLGAGCVTLITAYEQKEALPGAIP